MNRCEMLAAAVQGGYCRQMSKGILSPAYADALAQLPQDALTGELAHFWRTQADAGAPMRDRADVLADTLAILAGLNADAEVLAQETWRMVDGQLHSPNQHDRT